MDKQQLIQSVKEHFPPGEMLPIEVFNDWFTNILIPTLWREPNSGVPPIGGLPIIYGNKDPNNNQITEAYSLGWFYARTTDGTEGGDVIQFYQYNGKYWKDIINIREDEFVSYQEQEKTELQRSIARENIGLQIKLENLDPLEDYLNQLT